MKSKVIFAVICFLLSAFCLFADNEEEPFRIKDRTLEIGFLHTGIWFSNDFFAISEIFQEKIVFDTGKFTSAFRVNFDLDAAPLYFSYNRNNLWGFGLSLSVSAAGIFNLSENTLALHDAVNDKSFVSGAVFAEAKFSGFFTWRGIKIKINPSLYYPVVYISDSEVLYSVNTSDAAIIDISYKFKLYTAFPLGDESFRLTSAPGADIHLGVEYPLAMKLGLTEKYGFLDFSVALDFIGIPLVPSQMKDYMELTGRIGGGMQLTSDNFDDDDFLDKFFDVNDPVYGKDRKFILRPFKMLASADWKPFKKVPVSFIPVLGFAINPFYNKPVSMEGGIKACYNHANLFLAAFGMGYYNHSWRNSLDLALNFRYFEISVKLALSSQDFLKSWQGNGFGLSFGLKFGY